MFQNDLVKIGGVQMEWSVILMIILVAFLFIKVISKIVRILIGIALIVVIVYFVSSIELALIIVNY